MADWGQLGVDIPCADKLQGVGLKVQREEKCITCYAGDPNKRKNSFLVRSPVLSMQNLGSAELGGWVAMGMNPVPVSPACRPIWSLSCVPGGVNTAPKSYMGRGFLWEGQQDC